MSKLNRITHRFVERVPSKLEDGVVYVSIEFGTVIHKCCCGCGDKVVTPLTPVDWALIYDGQSISLRPSIGRWDAPCRSHYWIQKDCVMWSTEWSKDEVDDLKQHEAGLRDKYFVSSHDPSRKKSGDTPDQVPVRHGWLKRIWKKTVQNVQDKSRRD